MKRATAFPFIALTLLCLTGLLLDGRPTGVPKGGPIVGPDVAWMLTASGLVLLMTPGLSFFYGGMVSFKNVVSTMLQSMIALGVISLVWICVGFSLAFGDDLGGVVGDPRTFFMFNGVGESTHPSMAPKIPLILFATFQLKFAIITPALITGAFAERIRFSAYLLFMVLFSLFIYSPLAHMTWHPQGLFYLWGVKDFAGGTVVHMSAGFAALAGATLLGRRQAHQARIEHSPANIPFVIFGTALLWFGWFGFNAGSAFSPDATASLAFTTTNMAGASAMLAWIFFDWMKGNPPSALGACIGAVVGLVAITPAAGFVTVRESVFIGVFASIVSNIAVHLKTPSTLDDTLDVFPCHGVGGISGMLLTGVFAKDVGLTSGKYQTFLYHLLALAIVTVFAFGGSWILYKLTDLIIPLRVSERDEEIGLDISQHGETALDLEIFGKDLREARIHADQIEADEAMEEETRAIASGVN